MALTRDQMIEGTKRFYATMNSHNVDDILALIDDSVVDHQLPPGMPEGKEGAKAFFTMMITSTPDMKFEILDIVVDGNKIGVRSKVTGTQSGPFMDMPATNKSYSVEGIDIVTVNDDELVTEHWGIFDAMGMMMQTGLVEPPPQP
jgi:steroid delta-isomerase-like uncharacterized protein